MFPSLFISHGAPNIIIHDSLSKANIKSFAKSLKKPKYIIIFSAHYVTNDLKIINYENNDLLYDFYGFEKELYEYEYEIKSDKNLSHKIMDYLNENDIDISIDKTRLNYDHGVWSCLSMMYEKLDIPVIQLSIPFSYSKEQLINLGEKLAIFKEEALLIGSGGITHNLSDMQLSSTVKPYVYNFNNEITNIINSGNQERLLEIKESINYKKNHPSDEHFLPLFIIFGSAKNKKGISFNSEFMYSTISMECFAFDLKE
ncbi:MAG: dioxygenase [Campylobacteraceae bacterium]|nr:dioxygenase [Campylobacteraceae bacterium]